MDHADVRYLAAKRSVDERAFSRRVRATLRSEVPAAPCVLEAGCGTGITVPRLLDWGVDAGRYLGVDRDERVVAHARDARLAELRFAGRDVERTPRGGRVGAFSFAFDVGDVLAVFGSGDPFGDGDAGRATTPDPDAPGADGADLLVAQAFLDLVPLAAAVEAFEAALRPGGLAYFPITFDGGSVFQPSHPDDRAVERVYHAAIDETQGRDSRAGRHLMDLLRRREGTLLAVDGSDWVVRPRDGSYPADERYFLATILGFVADALRASEIDGGDWLAARREQLAAGELTYVAHQYDLLYRAP
jgi:SAM-dependent methyltransferase